MGVKLFSSRLAATAAVREAGLLHVPFSIAPSDSGSGFVVSMYGKENMTDPTFVAVTRGFKIRELIFHPDYPVVGKEYTHYKGNRYLVVAVSPETESMRLGVTYEPLYETDYDSFFRYLVSVDRKPSGWLNPLEDGRPRFERVRY